MGAHVLGASPSQCPECGQLAADLNRANDLYSDLNTLLSESAAARDLPAVYSALLCAKNSLEEVNSLRDQLRAHGAPFK
jgi:hypothetical protein